MEKEFYQQIVDKQLAISKDRISKCLTPVKNLTVEQSKLIMGTYRVAIEPNFIPWMYRAYSNARSEIAKKVIYDNIQDEISQDHPKMLRDFSDSAGVRISEEHYQRASEPVSRMWKLFSKFDSLDEVTVAATLENTSPIFIPYLVDIAKSLGSKNLVYTDMHGEADIAHAQELYKGLIEELNLYNNPYEVKSNDIKFSMAVERTTEFLEEILGVK